MDTAPRSDGKSDKKSGHSHRRPGGGKLSEAPESSRRFWIVIGVVAAVVLLLVAVSVAIAIVMASSGPKDKGQMGREPLRVDPNGDAKSFRRIQDAVNKANANDHILLMADVVEAGVQVARKENLVIESAPGRKAVWKCPDATKDNRMLLVENAPGFELKDVVLDGAQKVDSLITLFASCPGLKLSGLDLTNFKQYGINVVSCDGAEGRPVLLSGLHFTTANASQTGLYFTFTPSTIQKTQYFTVQDCSFIGPGHTVTASNPDAVRLTDGRKVEQAAPKP